MSHHPRVSASSWRIYIPKLITVLEEGYSIKDFMYRMANAVEIQTSRQILKEDVEDFSRRAEDHKDSRQKLPIGVEMFQLHGPFFFGAVSQLADVMEHIETPPKIFILDLSQVPMIDGSGALALDEFIVRCARHNTQVIFCGLKGQPRTIARHMGLLEPHKNAHAIESFNDAIEASILMVGA